MRMQSLTHKLRTSQEQVLDTKILLGEPVAQNITEETLSLIDKSNPPTLLLEGYKTGSDADIIYANSLIKQANMLGIKTTLEPSEHHDAVIYLGHSPEKIDYEKDVDGLSPISKFKPATAVAVMKMLEFYSIEITSKNVCIIGRSERVGKPLINLLLDKNATLTICHSKTKDLKDISSKADILIVAVGKSEFITKEYIKDNSTVIDVGINYVDGKLTGDVNKDSVIGTALNLSPVPLGIGKITTAVLLNNVAKSRSK